MVPGPSLLFRLYARNVVGLAGVGPSKVQLRCNGFRADRTNPDGGEVKAMQIWWIEEETVAGGRHPSATELEELSREGFTLIVSLLEEELNPPRYRPEDAERLGMRRVNLPVPDFRAPTLDQVREFIRLVQAEEGSGRVFVHCESGRGRTGTMAAALWMHRGLKPEDAIARVRRVKPEAIETREQEEQLHAFAHHLL